ncbi:MAG: hypothetical protein HYX27_26405 [Acidobacteria bacterium]|nr:hypothetical protein [Acidobacteriota bacterium]
MRPLGLRIAVLGSLCLLAYGPFLPLPLISDDYIQIHLGRLYGPWDQWGNLAHDALYRCRATSILLTHWTEAFFGVDAFPLNLSSLVLHFLNTLLVLLAGSWHRIGWRVSFPAACFFAAYQRPQEAVVWYAALPELLVFGFVIGGLLCWLRYLDRGTPWWYSAALGCFLFALLSKESAVVFAPMAAGLAWMERRSLRPAIPFFLLGAAYFAAAHSARDQHLHFNDGTFSLTAPFLFTAARSIGRLYWVWGLVATVVLLRTRRLAHFQWIAMATTWMFIALLPYSFLTYQNAVPSRHTYIASAGIAFILAKAFVFWKEQAPSRHLVTAVMAVCLLYQLGYLWLYKYPQYVERSRPTEELLQAVATHRGPVRITCFPYAAEVAQRALEISTRGKAWIVSAHEEASPRELRFDGCIRRQN